MHSFIPCFPDNKTYPKIRPSVNFKNDFNISPTLKISPSGERQKDERNKPSSLYWPTVLIQTAVYAILCYPFQNIFFSKIMTQKLLYILLQLNYS